MADYERYRYDHDRSEDRPRDRNKRERQAESGARRRRDDAYGRSTEHGYGDDDGSVARRGFGNEHSGYERGYDDRYGRGRERDFGASGGAGSGSSSRDRRDAMDEDRSRGSFERVRERRGGTEAGSWSSDAERRGRPGDDRSRHGASDFGASDFGRGSRGDEDRGFFERAGDEVRSWFGDDEAERRRMRDAGEGDPWARRHHRGRGPKNYTRSDERIRDDVNDRLTDDPHVDASDVEVSVSGREVTISGTVRSRFEKRHAEDIAETVSGVTHVQNNLRVQQPPAEGGAGTAFGGGSNPLAPSADAAADQAGGAGPGSRRRPSGSSGS